MPRNIFSKNWLDREYPSLVAVDDLLLDDLTRLEDDKLYSAGMKIAKDILHEMTVVGRTRRIGTDDTSIWSRGTTEGPPRHHLEQGAT